MSVQKSIPESQQIAEQSAPVVSGHTPTPWCFGRTGPEQRMILGSNDRYVCNVQIYQTPRNYGLLYEAEREANAALIVRAVNSLEPNEAKIAALVKALEDVRALIDVTGQPLWSDCRAAVEIVNAALASTREVQP